MSQPSETSDKPAGATAPPGTDTPTSRRKIHRSTYVFAGLTVVAMLLANIPGQVEFGPVSNPLGEWVIESQLGTRCDHGWPLVYLRRAIYWAGIHPPLEDTHDVSKLSTGAVPWCFWTGVVALSWTALVINFASAVAILVTTTWLYERWRRRRRRIWQLHLIDLVAIITIVSLALGWWYNKVQSFRSEKDALANLPMFAAHWKPGGTTWIRDVLSESPLSRDANSFRGLLYWPESARYFAPLDRVTGLMFAPRNRVDAITQSRDRFIEYLPRFRELAELHLSDITQAEWDAIATFPNVNDLDLLFSDAPPRTVGAWKSNPSIRVVSIISGKAPLLSILERLPNLQRLQIANGLFGPNVRIYLPDAEIDRVTSRDGVRDLALTGFKWSRVGLRKLLTLPRLESLEFYESVFDSKAVETLAEFKHLRYLGIFYANATRAELDQLQKLLPNCKVRLLEL